VYETLAPMTVPRSARSIASDDEFVLYAVVGFKKHSPEFIHKCREHRYTPRDYKHKEGGKEEEAKEVEKLEKEERKLWGEALRLGRTGYSESAMIWIHVLALRVFVETVLRYGLPLDYVAALVQVRLAILVLIVRLTIAADHTQASEEGETKSGLEIFIPRWQCANAGQEGPCQE